MNYLIRELKQDENKVLDTFLYEAIFIPEGVSAPLQDIINQPDLQVYVKDFVRIRETYVWLLKLGIKLLAPCGFGL